MNSTEPLSRNVNVRPAGLADAESLLQLHRDGFGSDWSMRQWRWRFVDNPLGELQIVGAFTSTGRCLVSFCGVPLPCSYRGEPALVQRAGDAIVHPQLRTNMAGSTLMLRAGRLFFGTFGSATMRMAFGFPEPGLTRTLVRHCRFEVMADVLMLVRDSNYRAPSDSGLVAAVAVTTPPDTDELASRWHRDASTGIVRNIDYLRWRYERNPHATYRFVTTRSPAGRLRGLAVLRPGGLDPEALAIVEWIVPLDDEAAARELLGAVATVARAEGCGSLVVSFGTSSPEFGRFQAAHGFRVIASPFRFAFRSYSAGVNQRFLFDHWHHSLGDMDFM